MNSTNIIWQLTQTSFMMLFGLCSMFLFDVMNEIFHQIRLHRYKRTIAEFITMLFCGCVFCMLLIWQNYGMIRSYVLLGLFLGIIGYYICLRNISRKCCQLIASAVLWCFRVIRNIILAPWKGLNRFLLSPINLKITAIRQKYKEAKQTNDELEEII